MRATGTRSPVIKERGMRLAAGQPHLATNSHLDCRRGGQIACYVHQVSCLALEQQNTKHQQKKPVISLSASVEISFPSTCAGGTAAELSSAHRQDDSCQRGAGTGIRWAGRGFQMRKPQEGICCVVSSYRQQESKNTKLIY